MKQTEYFKRRALGERPYIELAWCEAAGREPEATEVQSDGRVRHWRFVPELSRRAPTVDGAGSGTPGCRLARESSSLLGPHDGWARRQARIMTSTPGGVRPG